jgi:diacylglycerol kinase
LPAHPRAIIRRRSGSANDAATGAVPLARLAALVVRACVLMSTLFPD